MKPSELETHDLAEVIESKTPRPAFDSTVPAGSEAAGFWVRAGAHLIDSLATSLLTLPLLGLNYLAQTSLVPQHIDSTSLRVGLQILSFIFSGLYAGYFYSKKAATPGKMYFKLYVVRRDTGERLSFWTGFWRDTLGKLLSTLPLGIGFLMALFNGQKMTLHDYIFATRVLRRRG